MTLPINSDQQKEKVHIETGIEGPIRIGAIIAFLVFGVFGLWSLLAPLDGAAHAQGIVTVKSYKKQIQHLEGGIVGAIPVQNGDYVEAGDVILVLDSTQPLAQLEISNAQLNSLMATEARLLAERDGLSQVNYNTALLSNPNAASEIEVQNQIFQSGKISRDGRKAVLEQRIDQLRSRLEGQISLRESKSTLARSYAEEVADVQSLLSEGFADKNRLRELERNQARLEGEVAELIASISGTQIQIGETELEILQQEKEFQSEVLNQLSETQTRMKDISERKTALEDIVARTVIRAPVSGVINGMQIHTIGGVIAPGTPIADIVPQSEEMIVEARVPLADIDRVEEGQQATMRFSAFNRSVPSIDGKLLTLSADSFLDERTGSSYYLARIEVTEAGLAELDDLELIPGMPVEVFIATGSRTFMQYLLKPITNSMARSMIED